MGEEYTKWILANMYCTKAYTNYTKTCKYCTYAIQVQAVSLLYQFDPTDSKIY